MLADYRRVPDDWHDCLLALRALGVGITEQAAKVAHLMSWYQQNKDIAALMGLQLSKVKVLVHDVLVLLAVDDRDAAGVIVRNAVEAWRADRDRQSASDAPASPPRPRRPRADPHVDGHDRQRPAPSA